MQPNPAAAGAKPADDRARALGAKPTAHPAEPADPPAGAPAGDRLADYRCVRDQTESLCEPLATEDYVIQSMTQASPAKWHLAHTTWFFEQFILQPHAPGYRVVHPDYAYIFNSYYNTVGPQHCRNARGLVSRPTVEEVYTYRRAIDQRLADWAGALAPDAWARVAPLIELGLHHEQQHQELLVTDLKHMLSSNPLLPAYRERKPDPVGEAAPLRFVAFPEGVVEIGHGGGGFAYDNESPRHKVYLQRYELADRLTTNAEYLAFIEDGGYRRAELWLSEGFATVTEAGWDRPMYWFERDGRWMQYTLAGAVALAPDEPVSHLSYFEADAFARWAGARLPTEAEWESAAAAQPIAGRFAESGRLHPRPADPRGPGPLRQCFGDLWEWTASSFAPYPGFTPLPGALGEYNGKFMVNQYVLRGGSCATPQNHIRPTYRNFFAADSRWQFTGLRLARSA